MAKLKAPLFSLGASGKLGGALVFFPWKGLNVVREYVIPTNPDTVPQQTQRGYITTVVAYIHAMQAAAQGPKQLDATDQSAYSLWASALGIVCTWFNMICKNFLDTWVSVSGGRLYCGGALTPGADQVAIQLYSYPGIDTTGDFYYGLSKTNMVNSQVAVIAGDSITCTIAGLTTGKKYYFQYVPTGPATIVGAKSGIYHSTPT